MSKLDWQLLPICTLFILAILAVGTALSKDSGREEEIKCSQATVDARQE